MFVMNKYYRWYYQIINRARKRGKPNEYFEKHHVIPRCMGGTNDFWNVVNLTFREHYLVHWLLTKFVKGDDFRKMCCALSAMSETIKGSKRKIPSWCYERSRRANTEASIGREHTEKTKLKISIAHTGKRKHNEESKRKIGLSSKNRIVSEETRKKISLASKGRKYPGRVLSEETKLKISLSMTGKKQSDATKRKKSVALKGRKPDEKAFTARKVSIKVKEHLTRLSRDGHNVGRKHTDKAKQNMKAAWVKRRANKALPVSGARCGYNTPNTDYIRFS